MDYVECQSGVYDCSFDGLEDAGATECSPYNNHYMQLQGELWVVIVATAVMGGMGISIGGNDVANAWGTSVGSGAIKVQHALMIAAVSNILGATLLGSGVADKLQHGVTPLDNPDCFACGYCNSKISLYSLGMLSALFSAAMFLSLATMKKLPVSTSHAIVGGIVGITLAANRDVALGLGGVFRGIRCVDWTLTGLSGMVTSWILSPLLSGILCCLLYSFTFRIIYRNTLAQVNLSTDAKKQKCEVSRSPKESESRSGMIDNDCHCDDDYVERTLRLIPFCYAGMIWTMVFLISSKSAVSKNYSLRVHLSLSSAIAVVVFCAVYIGLIPRIKLELKVNYETGVKNDSTQKGLSDSTHSNASAMDTSSSPFVVVEAQKTCENSSSLHLQDSARQRYLDSTMKINEVNFCFQYLLLSVAALESFAHGANDTANSTAAFSAVISVYDDGLDVCSSHMHTPMWVMAVGGTFVGVGVLFFGRGVIETIGHRLTAALDCHKGFCIEFSSCTAVVVASALGMPVSTTHCQVGAVIAIGIQSAGIKSVDWMMVKDIVLSWLLTVPFAAVVAAGIFNMLKLVL